MAVGFGLFMLWAAAAPSCFGANVTYDHRALVIDGRRRVLVSGSIHYPRSTPEVSICTQISFPHTQHTLVRTFFFIFLIDIFSNVKISDVGGLDTEIKGGRIGCDRNLCFLEFA